MPAFAGATEVVWKLDLKVKPDGAEPFDAHVEARLPQYTMLRVGSLLVVGIPVLLVGLVGAGLLLAPGTRRALGLIDGP